MSSSAERGCEMDRYPDPESFLLGFDGVECEDEDAEEAPVGPSNRRGFVVSLPASWPFLAFRAPSFNSKS